MSVIDPPMDNPFQSPESALDDSLDRGPSTGAKRLNPWFWIPFRPRATIRQIVEIAPRRLLLVTLLGGVAVGCEPMTMAVLMLTSEFRPGRELFQFSLATGVVGSLFAVYCLSDLVRWVASRFGGVATTKEMRAAIAWSQVTTIWALLWYPLAIGLVDLTRSGSVQAADSVSDPTPPVGVYGVAIFWMVCQIWRVVTFCKVVAEVNRFSAWRAMLAAIFAALLILMPLFILMVALGG